MGAWTTAIKTWAVGDKTSATVLNAQLKDFASAFGAWNSYSPSWTSSGTAPALGNGVLVGSYIQVQKLVIARLALTTGSSTTYGTGTYAFSLPVSANSSALLMGTAQFYDSSGTAFKHGAIRYASSTTANMTSDSGWVAATSPWTWAQSDEIRLLMVYEAA